MTRFHRLLALTALGTFCGCQTCSDCLDDSSPVSMGESTVVYDDGSAAGSGGGFYEEGTGAAPQGRAPAGGSGTHSPMDGSGYRP